MRSNGARVELSYDVTVTTTYRVKADAQPSYTRARQQVEALRREWGDDPTYWPEGYGGLEVVDPARAEWKLNNVEHVRDSQGFEQL